ncbi:AsmA family protein [Pseudomonas sp. CCI3.2]|uniref:AsmA family protein n=1 Tax=unclassified Pseudomonas TaxID=196821 RepID=UPI002AC9B873|nr:MULTISPECIES: AsmA family protein [unclassified Pseudomonas]MEB0076844.1 AsmA family protein [Pseudomonas sp. MH10out]MEB0091806.1 AsmA family protein [Pseudomonas sp. CCI4.2]MEB0103259.1 AsmA family protein [Pseudomonas sp. CCI3.2]MEB0119223.1 AsmA family protein [Pseudomonas sp. CCI1.2]MEB0129717.1 AsmA family protein [Pseudomonas sp. CCI2.4]
MKAFGKILGLVILGLLLIIVALGFALTHFFDPNDYKDEIRQLARDKAHVELTLKGDIGWSLFPWLGLELHDASVATLVTPTKPFADLQMLGLSVRVLPLLRREVQMSDVRIEGLNLTLNRDENGHGNWEDIGRPAPSTVAPAPTPENASANSGKNTPAAPDKSSQPIKLDIDSLTVNNARIDYSDAKTGRQFTAESIQLSTGAVHEGANIPIKFTSFFSTNQPVIRAKTELVGQLRFDRALKRYQFEDMRLSGEASGDPLDGNTLTFAAQGQLLVDMAANIADWNGLKFSANQLRALGELHVRDLDKTPQLSGGLSIAQFNLRDFLESIGQTVPDIDKDSLKKVELVGRLTGSPTSLAVEDLNMKVDDSTFSGRLAVDDFAKQAIRIQLKADTFDADRYRPARSDEANSAGAARKSEVTGTENQAFATAGGTTPLPNQPTQVAWSNDRLLPLERMRKLDAQADLSFGQLTIDRLPIRNAVLKTHGLDGQITLDSLRGNISNGDFEVKGTLDVRPDLPVVTLQTRVNKVPVESFYRSEDNAPVRGLLTSRSDMTGKGNSQKALIDGLNGTASFMLNNGVLVNANLEQQVCQGIAKLNRKTLSAEPHGKDTPFQQLGGTLVIRNGVASNPDLKVQIPGLTVNGNGDIDLRVLGMDYRIGIIVEGDKSDMPDPACQVNDRYANFEFPLRCRGPLELGAKACRVDNEGLVEAAAKLAGDKIEQKIDDKLGDKINPQLKDALKGLFKR